MAVGETETRHRGTRVFAVVKFVLITIVVVAVLAVGALAFMLHRWASTGDGNQHAADSAVARSAQRYTDALRGAFTRGSVTAGQVLALRQSAYAGEGGGLAQGIGPVGARTGGGTVIMTFQVSAQHGGGFSQRLSGECFRDVFHQSPAGVVTATRTTINCRFLLPELKPEATLRVR